MNTHAIGDCKSSCFRCLCKGFVGKSRPALEVEHAQVVEKQDLEKFGPKSDSVSAAYHATSDMEWADERLGEDRITTAYTFKELLDWSGKVALGTDFPVEKVIP